MVPRNSNSGGFTVSTRYSILIVRTGPTYSPAIWPVSLLRLLLLLLQYNWLLLLLPTTMNREHWEYDIGLVAACAGLEPLDDVVPCPMSAVIPHRYPHVYCLSICVRMVNWHMAYRQWIEDWRRRRLMTVNEDWLQWRLTTVNEADLSGRDVNPVGEGRDHEPRSISEEPEAVLERSV